MEDDDCAILGYKCDTNSYGGRGGGVLSLLFSSTRDSSLITNNSNTKNDGDGFDTNETTKCNTTMDGTSLVALCEAASHAARMASKSSPYTITPNNNKNQQQRQTVVSNHHSTTNPNTTTSLITTTTRTDHHVNNPTATTNNINIRESIAYHTQAAQSYRQAAISVKGMNNKTLSLLAYSLLVLSHGQARSADSLLKNGVVRGSRNDVGGGVKGVGMGGYRDDGGEVLGSDGKKVTSGDGGGGGGRGAITTDALYKRSNSSTHDDRLRATIRASMGKPEADMTDSIFLGKATSSGGGGGGGNDKTCVTKVDGTTMDNNKGRERGGGNVGHTNAGDSMAWKEGTSKNDKLAINNSNKIKKSFSSAKRNPIDDMMELEQELKDMDMALEMGVDLNSINNSALSKKAMIDPEGSFCLVSAGSMSSSMMWGAGLGRNQKQQQQHQHQQQQQLQQQRHPISAHNTTANTNGIGSGRTRAIRAQTILDGSHGNTVGALKHHQHNHNQMDVLTHTTPKQVSNPGLESSWWGQASTLSQSTHLLGNSMVGIRSSSSQPQHQQQQQQHQQDHHQQQQSHGNDGTVAPANTKQLIRLLDSLQTLTDENTSLMGQLEEAQKARVEAKAAREAMRRFKEEYGKRYAMLKSVVDKVQKEFNDPQQQHSHDSTVNSVVSGGYSGNIVSNSQFAHDRAEIQKRDQIIQKLSLDVRKEKEEGKKKDDALRKYENFYKEVKARSALKAKQREEELRKKKEMSRKQGIKQSKSKDVK